MIIRYPLILTKFQARNPTNTNDKPPYLFETVTKISDSYYAFLNDQVHKTKFVGETKPKSTNEKCFSNINMMHLIYSFPVFSGKYFIK